MTTTPSPEVAIIAEDEELGRLLLAESVASLNLKPVMFDNGRQAVEAALSQDVAIIFLDVDMPGMDGYTACRQIRDSDKRSTVPIVMVTGHEDEFAINRAFTAGATDYISKPVNWGLLPHRLAYILRNAAAARALAEGEAKVRALVEALPDAMWVVSPTGQPRWSPNGSATRSSADNRIVAPNWQLTDHLPPSCMKEVIAAIGRTARDGITRKIVYQDDRGLNCPQSAELRFTPCEGGDVLIVRQDTTERTIAAKHIEQLAYFDPLTGLPNRQHSVELTRKLLSQAAASSEGVAAIYLDLNGFKRINDTFGHAVGDAVLRKVAETLALTLSRFNNPQIHASLSRLAGDEFLILVRDAAAGTLALQIAEGCCASLKEPISCGELDFFASPSIGLAIYPEHGSDVEALLKNADTARYHSKTCGVSTISVYEEAMSARLRDRLELESRLRRAVREDLLSLRFQPKFRLDDNLVVGAEALLRWCDAEFGDIEPNRFIPIAEETGLIVDIGAWVIRSVCQQLRMWLDRGISVPIAINISGKELSYGDPAAAIEAETSRFRLPPSLIEVEITESVFVSDSKRSRDNIKRLRDLGCRITLDDFGTGYSSLAYLTRFPPDRVKIDRSFVQYVDQSASDAGIVNAIMSLARNLKLVVTAEGVERPGQIEWLRRQGCHEVQGFLLARPLHASELESRFLRAHEEKEAALGFRELSA